VLYDLCIFLYLCGVAVASLFSEKVKKMWRGERQAIGVLKEKVEPGARYVWFHAASLGEFEQGRPLMERIRKEHPELKILLTFFSPSGYEVRKDYAGADIICYLPLDTPRNARRFLRAIRPEMAFFIKYEFWYNYLHILRHRGVPTYSVSSIFRPGQIFFRWYGKQYGHVLRCFTKFFVQNEQSKSLLESIGINNVSITGDTRFDRVLQIKGQSKQLDIIDAFVAPRQGERVRVFVAGSSWQPDEDIFIPYFEGHSDWRLIIAPHVVSEEHLQQIESKLSGRKVLRYSKATPTTAAEADCLLIDCFGLLSSIYRYADVTYVGGGFGVGIHNILEAAVWGKPVVFGPNNQNFQEAQQMKQSGGHEISSYSDFAALMDGFIEKPETIAEEGQKAADYVSSKAGATDLILSQVAFK